MKHAHEIEEALFEAAVVMETDEGRQAFLDLVRHGDSRQSERLGQLLSTHLDANRFFYQAECDRTVVAVEAGEEMVDRGEEGGLLGMPGGGPEERKGERIGRYRLMERIGEGGCGVVYLAEQFEPVRRTVALKVIRLGMDTERVIARFEMERQSLAMMDHPNIARVLDGGATESGRPYFVMEWVRGMKITAYCDENKLSVPQRISLFIEVCKAIQHAHQKGVIHRDIKPSNILVSVDGGSPSPKVIDFGVAKAIGGDVVLETVTAHEHFIGTPAYMSPEQAGESQDIDTRSDVYSLGVLLYELLVGRGPFDAATLGSVGMLEMRRILIEREARMPSSVLETTSMEELDAVCQSRCTDAKRLMLAIRGDLDSVTMKAIEKDRTRRYETVNALAMDLQRYLDHEAVLARRQGRIYLLGKFVRRNRLAVGAGVAIVISLILGLGTASAFYVREKKSREEQVRLLEVAESAHEGEQQRLVEARQWENFAAVSILLSAGKMNDADEKLRQTPLSSIQLTPSSAEIVRSLANWNALRGRWRQSSECYKKLLNADARVTSMAGSWDLIAMATVLKENRDMEGFELFRDWAFKQFGDSSELVPITRFMRSALLMPADAAYLAKLEPLRAHLQKSNFDPAKLQRGVESNSAVWRALTLAQYEYRKGDFEASRKWAELALGYQSRTYVKVNIRPILAMALFRLGRVDEAKAQLNAIRAKIGMSFSPDLPAAYEPFGKNEGYWWDWVIARSLFQEAEDLIAGASRE